MRDMLMQDSKERLQPLKRHYMPEHEIHVGGSANPSEDGMLTGRNSS